MKNEKRLTRVCAYARERAQVMKRRVGGKTKKWGGKCEKRPVLSRWSRTFAVDERGENDAICGLHLSDRDALCRPIGEGNRDVGNGRKKKVVKQCGTLFFPYLCPTNRSELTSDTTNHYGKNHRNRQPKGWGGKNDHFDQPCRLACHAREKSTPRGLRPSGQCVERHRSRCRKNRIVGLRIDDRQTGYSRKYLHHRHRGARRRALARQPLGS